MNYVFFIGDKKVEKFTNEQKQMYSKALANSLGLKKSELHSNSNAKNASKR